MILKNEWQGIPLFERARGHVRKVATVVDVGSGIRPQLFVECQRHICIEPHWEYCEALTAGGYDVLHGAAPQCLRFIAVPVDTVVMLDVIEHMTREDGARSLEAALALAREQVIVFTPLGFMAQSGGEKTDAWGMQGQKWQEHRSGWTPDEFPGWLHLVDHQFALGHAAFFAIWDRGASK